VINFPNSPTIGQLFSAGGYIWRWDGTHWVSGLPTISNPNKLINPFMEIDQANEGTAVAFSASTSGPTVDGWSITNALSAGGVLVQRVTDAPPGYPNSLQLTMTAAGVTGAGTALDFEQRIEANSLVDIAFGTASAQPLSLAFWVKASIAGTYSACLRNSGTTRSYVFNFVISTANVWQLIIQSIPGDTGGTWVLVGANTGMFLDIVLNAGSSYQTTPNQWQTGNLIGTSSTSTTFATVNGATFQLGPCKLEVGSAATPMLRTSIQEELARCQRYYEKSYAYGTAPGTVSTGDQHWLYIVPVATTVGPQEGGTYIYKVTKRATPTITMYSSNSGASGKLYDRMDNTDITGNLFANGPNYLCWYGALSSSTQVNVQICGHFVADARL
jgi:hypothetical protein